MLLGVRSPNRRPLLAERIRRNETEVEGSKLTSVLKSAVHVTSPGSESCRDHQLARSFSNQFTGFRVASFTYFVTWSADYNFFIAARKIHKELSPPLSLSLFLYREREILLQARKEIFVGTVSHGSLEILIETKRKKNRDFVKKKVCLFYQRATERNEKEMGSIWLTKVLYSYFHLLYCHSCTTNLVIVICIISSEQTCRK